MARSLFLVLMSRESQRLPSKAQTFLQPSQRDALLYRTSGL